MGGVYRKVCGLGLDRLRALVRSLSRPARPGGPWLPGAPRYFDYNHPYEDYRDRYGVWRTGAHARLDYVMRQFAGVH
jgi:hypothetical protein